VRFVKVAVMEEKRVVSASALNTNEEALKIESHDYPLIFHR
jgi:hypothetical protein